MSWGMSREARLKYNRLRDHVAKQIGKSNPALSDIVLYCHSKLCGPE